MRLRHQASELPPRWVLISISLPGGTIFQPPSSQSVLWLRISRSVILMTRSTRYADFVDNINRDVINLAQHSRVAMSGFGPQTNIIAYDL